MSQKRMYSQTTSSTKDGYQTTKKSRSTRKKTYSKPQMSAGVLAKAIKKELYKQAETKHVSLAGIELSMSSLSTGSGLPFISQPYPQVGAESTQRIGNKIQPVGFSFKAVYWNAHSYPVVVRRLIMSIQDGERTNSDILLNMFEGNGTNVDTYDLGNMDSLIRKVNREGYKVLKDDLIHMGINNGGKSIETSNCYVKLGGVQLYRDKDVTHALNDRIVVVHIVREGDGDESTGSTVELSYACDFYYKDV